MTKKKLLLNENATRRFMKLASIDPAFVSNFLNEAEEEAGTEGDASEQEVGKDRLEQLKKIVRDNPFYKEYNVNDTKADELTKDMVIDPDHNKFIYLNFPGDLDSDHIQKHFDHSPENAASIFSISEDQVLKHILEMINDESPPGPTEEFGSIRYKWLNKPLGSKIGYDSLKKVGKDNMETKPDLERFGMIDRANASDSKITWEMIAKVIKGDKTRDIEPIDLVKADNKKYTETDFNTRTSDGKRTPGFIKQEIGVVRGDKKDNPTKLFNFVATEIGKYNEKPVLAFVTVFPGHSPVTASGDDVKNKKDYKDHGYAFLKSS